MRSCIEIQLERVEARSNGLFQCHAAAVVCRGIRVLADAWQQQRDAVGTVLLPGIGCLGKKGILPAPIVAGGMVRAAVEFRIKIPHRSNNHSNAETMWMVFPSISTSRVGENAMSVRWLQESVSDALTSDEVSRL